MTSGQLLREARLRAGLTQAELEGMTGKDRASIARWERDDVTPSFEALQLLLRGCGFDLALVAFEQPFADEELREQLRLTPKERIERVYTADATPRTRKRP